MNALLARMLAQVDISVVFAVQAVTAAIRNVLNVWSKTRLAYTDWAMPFVAITLGVAFGLVRRGASWDAALYGITLGGGAIFFQTMFTHGASGLAVLRGKSKDDPLVQAKVNDTAASADKQILFVQNLFNKPPVAKDQPQS